MITKKVNLRTLYTQFQRRIYKDMTVLWNISPLLCLGYSIVLLNAIYWNIKDYCHPHLEGNQEGDPDHATIHKLPRILRLKTKAISTLDAVHTNPFN